jgi:ABC-type branched-subunit amino acid transport system substrate-binding protein
MTEVMRAIRRLSGGFRALSSVAIASAVVIALAGLNLVWSGSSSAASTKSPLYIGAVMSLTGPYSSYEIPEYAGVKWSINRINAKGGLLGHKLVLVTADDESQATKVGPAIQQLLSEHTYLAVYPDSVPELQDIILPYLTRAHVFSFAGSAEVTNEYDPSANPYSFYDYFTQAEQMGSGVAAIEAKVAKGVKIGIIEDNLAGTTALDDIFQKEAKAAGDQVVSRQSVAPTTTDLSLQVKKAQSAGAKALWIWSTPSLCTEAATAADAIGYKVKIFSGSTAVTQSVMTGIPATFQKDFFAAGLVADLRDPATGGPTPNLKVFEKQVYRKYPGVDLGLSAISADTMTLLGWAVDKAGSTSPKKVLTVMNSLHRTTLPAHLLLVLPNPRYSATNHQTAQLNAAHSFAVFGAGAPVSGTYSGSQLNLDSVLKSS